MKKSAVSTLGMLALLAASAHGAMAGDRDKGIRIFDTHAHLLGRDSDFISAAENALSAMADLNIARTLVMPPPFTPNQRRLFRMEALRDAVAAAPDRLGFLGGGGSLNVMIQEAVRAGTTSVELKVRFRARAQAIVDAGAFGFGEMTAEHVSRRRGHPYLTAPPDHPLFLLLADIAAERRVPIDLHMEAVPRDMVRPDRLDEPNPATLKANIAAFERLLSHNREARIIWAHAGWGNTGARLPNLMDRLLAAHPNLYMSLKINRSSRGAVRPLDRDGRLRPDWRSLLESYGGRFMIGSDHKYRGHGRGRGRGEDTFRRLLSELSENTARAVAWDNAIGLFGFRKK